MGYRGEGHPGEEGQVGHHVWEGVGEDVWPSSPPIHLLPLVGDRSHYWLRLFNLGLLLHRQVEALVLTAILLLCIDWVMVVVEEDRSGRAALRGRRRDRRGELSRPELMRLGGTV